MHSDKNQQLFFVLQMAEGMKQFILPSANEREADALRYRGWIISSGSSSVYFFCRHKALQLLSAGPIGEGGCIDNIP